MWRMYPTAPNRILGRNWREDEAHGRQHERERDQRPRAGGSVTIALRIDPGHRAADPGGSATFHVQVLNGSGVVDRVALEVLGSAAPWSTIDPVAVALFPGADGAAVVTVRPPPGAPLGQVPLGLRAVAESSGATDVGEATLTVGTSHRIDAELRPRTAKGRRRATSLVVLRNAGNATATLAVVASDPDDAITFDGPKRVRVGPGQVVDVPLRMRLPTREKPGATLPYQVLLEGDAGCALDGQVRQPPKRRWLLALVAALVAAAVAASLLRSDDSVAITGGEGAATTTTAQDGAPAQPAAEQPPPGNPPPPGAEAPAPAPVVPTAPAPGAAPPSQAGDGPGGTGPAAPGPALAPGAAAPPPASSPPRSVGPEPRAATTLGPPDPPPLPCPEKGSADKPESTALRVLCAWELGRLKEVTDSTTPDSAATLQQLTPAGGQAVTLAAHEKGGAWVYFSGCPKAGGAGLYAAYVGTYDPSLEGRVVQVKSC